MKKSSLFLSVSAAILALAGSGSAIAGKTEQRPLIGIPTVPQIAPQCDATVKKAKAQVAAIEKMALPKAGLDASASKKLYAQLDQLAIILEDTLGPMDLISNVSPDAKVREAAEPCLVQVNAYATELFQNDKLFQRVLASKPSDPIETKLRQDYLDGFEDTGVSLPKEKQEKMKALAKKLNELQQEFDRNVRDNTEKLSFTADEVKGMSAEYLAAAKKDDKGNYLLGYDYPTYNPFMEYAENDAARKRLYTGYTNRGSARNLEILKETMQLRRELAGLFGFNNYADYVARRRMAGSASAVNKFLGEVQTAVTELEKKEVEELRVFKAESLKTPLADTKFNRWDAQYWQQKLKSARYKLDQNEMRKYFPTHAAIPWALDVSSKLYGVQFKAVTVPVWHKEVQYYDVIDGQSGKRIAGVYLDLYKRDGKYGHAAVWPVRGGSTLIQRTPISALVTNLNPVGLDISEMETLVHEFGHALHGVLSNTRYVRHAGTSVELDFVEAPSQMFEEWARSKESLAGMTKFCKPACPSVDDELIKRMTAAHNFGRGLRFGRQLVYAGFDMQIHNAAATDPMVEWKKVEAATPLGHVEGTNFPSQFNHLMGGYGAGYYGYMWSEVMALDMLSGYKGKLMNPEVGMHYRKTVLSRGGEKRGGELVRDFLGREASSKAFFDEISGQRLQ